MTVYLCASAPLCAYDHIFVQDLSTLLLRGVLGKSCWLQDFVKPPALPQGLIIRPLKSMEVFPYVYRVKGDALHIGTTVAATAAGKEKLCSHSTVLGGEYFTSQPQLLWGAMGPSLCAQACCKVRYMVWLFVLRGWEKFWSLVHEELTHICLLTGKHGCPNFWAMNTVLSNKIK